METIKTNNAELLLVKVPSDAHSFEKHNYYISYMKDNLEFNLIGCRVFEIVNTLSNLTEEQAKELDYTLESFHSLMAANEVYLEESEYLILIKK